MRSLKRNLTLWFRVPMCTEKMNCKARILILEDDQALATVLKTTLESSGYSVNCIEDPDEALEAVQGGQYEVLLVDVLLSGMTGVDFALKVRGEFKNTQSDIIFMSGVFKDKSFIKETVSSTKALSYLQKPFDPAELVATLDRRYCVVSGEDFQGKSSRQIINEILYRGKTGAAQTLRSIGALREIHGFDFPMIFSFLLETGITGELHLKQDASLESQVHITQGNVVSVSTTRHDSMLGNLLIEMGYLKADDLNRVLGDPDIDQTEKLGTKLVKANVMSPHAFLLALERQMVLRLSRWVIPKNIEFRFTPVEVKLEEPCLSSEGIVGHLHDWVMANIRKDWLETIYRHFEGARLVKGSRLQLQHEIFKTSLFKENKVLQKTLLETSYFSDLFTVDIIPKEELLKGLHLLVSKRLISFSQDEVQDYSEEELLEKFTVLHEELKGKDFFARVKSLGVALDANANQVYMALDEFVEGLPFPQDLGSESAKMRTEVISLLQEAVQVIGSPDQRKTYEEKMQRKAMEVKIQIREKMDLAKKFLNNSNGREALIQLKEVELAQPETDELGEHIIWAKICMLNTKNKGTLLKEINKLMSTIPAERKFTPLFMYLEGMLLIYKGNFASAQDKMQRALDKSPSMVEAKRALNIIRLKKEQKKKDQDILNRDLGEVVKSWFKKQSA